MANLSLFVGATDWTASTVWSELRLSVRDSIGIAATVVLDVTGVTDVAPGPLDRFTLTLPTGEKFVLIPEGENVVKTYATSSHNDTDPVVLYTYSCVDPLTALDRLPLPELVFIDETTGDLLAATIAAMDATLDTSGLTDGNTVPFLDLSKVNKFSDILSTKEIATGNYIVTLDPTTGLKVIGDFKENFGATGLVVDFDNGNIHDFTPTKEPLTPDNEIINYQKVKGRSEGGPHHSVMEFREIDVYTSSFKLAALPFGVNESQLLSVQFENGLIDNTFDADQLPTAIPLRWPVSIEVADIVPDLGTGEVCQFLGKSSAVLLSCLVGASTIGAKVSGTTYNVTTPFCPDGQPADTEHQYYYDWHADFIEGDQLKVTATEYYLDALAGERVLATVSSVNTTTRELTLSLASGVSISDLPSEIRFFTAGDPEDVLWFAKITARSGSVITIDELPDSSVDLTTTEVGSGDGTTVTETTKTIYSGAAPANQYGRPVAWVSGAVHARMWRASFGPAIMAELLTDTAYGVTGRKLRVDAGEASRSTDLVITASGSDSAIATLTTHFPVLEGPAKIILNYDASKQPEYIAQDAASQALYGIRKGDDIESELAYTVADCQEIAEAIVSEFAYPSPQGTIQRESWLVDDFPLPPKTVFVDLPPEYKMAEENIPISEVSVSFKGWDSTDEEGVVDYQINLGKLESVEIANRYLLGLEQSRAGNPFFGTSGGPRITGASWNDTDTCTLTIPGVTTITLNGKTAGLSFDPRNYAAGPLRAKPVLLTGSTGGLNVLQVEVIYPPDPVDATTARYSYNAKSNTIRYRWARPSGAISFIIERQKPSDGSTESTEWEKIDEVFNTSYPLPYEPLSKKLRITAVGLALKKSAPVELTATLPQLDAPSLFDVVRVSAHDRIVFRISGAPKRAEFLRIYTRRVTDGSNPGVDEAAWLTFFDVDNADTNIEDFPALANTHRRKVEFEDTRLDDVVWCTAAWVDRFGDISHLYTPYDATRPPLEVVSVDPATFFRSPDSGSPGTNQANGGTIEDDNDETTQVDFSGTFRVELARGVETVRLWFEECTPTSDHSVGTWGTRPLLGPFHEDVTDEDATNGYMDIDVKQKFRWSKKKRRTYRLAKVVCLGARVRERIGPSTEEEPVREKKFLIGLDPYLPTPDTIPYTADGYFDKTLFEFKPGINGLANNLTAITGLAVAERASGFKVKWNPINDVSVRRYVVLVSDQDFGTKGPGTDTSIDAALDALVGSGSLTVYRPDNTTEDRTVYAIDSGVSPSHRFYDGENIGGLTIASGTTYYVSVIAQTKNGRWCSEFVDPVSTMTGVPESQDAIPEDPITPSLGHIVRSVIVGDPADGNAEVTFSIYASASDPGVITFGDNNIDTAVLTFTNPDDAFRPIHYSVAVDPASANMLVTVPFKAGKAYTWTGLRVKNTVSSRTVSSSIGFTAGAGANIAGGAANAYAFDASGSTLGAPTLTYTQANSQHGLLTLAYTQPGRSDVGPVCPVLLKKIAFEVTYNASAGTPTWIRIRDEDINCLDDVDDYSGEGAQTVTARVKHLKNQSDMKFRATLIPFGSNFATSSLNKVVTQGTAGESPGDGDADIASSGLTLVAGASIVSTVIGDPVGGVAEAQITVSTTGTWGAPGGGGGPIRQVEFKIAGTGTPTGQPILFGGTVDPAASSTTFSTKVEIGKSYSLTEIKYSNNSDVLTLTGTKAFTGGSNSVGFDASAIVTGVSLSVTAIDDRHVQATLAFTQPATPVLIKRVVFESNDTGSYMKEASENTMDDAAYLTVGGRAVTISKKIKIKKDVASYTIRAVIVPVNSAYKNAAGTVITTAPNKVVTSSAQSSGPDSLLGDRLHGRGNLVIGGDHTFDSPELGGAGAVTDLGKNWRTTAGGATRISTAVASGTRWIKGGTGFTSAIDANAAHCLELYTSVNNGSSTFATKVKGSLGANEVYWLTFAIAGNSGRTISNVIAAITDSAGVTIASRTFDIDVTTTFKLFAVKFAPTTVASGITQNWLTFNFPDMGNATSKACWLSKVCLVCGDEPMMYEPSAAESDASVSANVVLRDFRGLNSLGHTKRHWTDATLTSVSGFITIT